MPKSAAVATISRDLAQTRRRDVLRMLKLAEKDKSWNAVASLILQLRKADEVVAFAQAAEEAAKTKTEKLTPAESAARLEELVLQAPISVQAKIYKRIQEAHPEWDEENAW